MNFKFEFWKLFERGSEKVHPSKFAPQSTKRGEGVVPTLLQIQMQILRYIYGKDSLLFVFVHPSLERGVSVTESAESAGFSK